MCGLKELTDKPIFDPSLFVYVRKRITEKEINDMSVQLLKEEQKRKADAARRNGGDDSTKCGGHDGTGSQREALSADSKDADDFGKEFTDSNGRKHKGVLKIDATCANAEVRYPVDVDIIHDGCKVVDRYIRELCKALGLQGVRTSYKDARRVYLELVKLKKKGCKLERQTRAYMFKCLNNDLRCIVGIFVDHNGSTPLLPMH